MHANVEDRGIKGDITPLMAAASGGYVDIVKLLLVHGADVNAQSSSGTVNPLGWTCPSSGDIFVQSAHLNVVRPACDVTS